MRTWTLVLLVACTNPGVPSQMPSDLDDAGAGMAKPLELCALCREDRDCKSGLCWQYGDGYRKCTLACEPMQEAPQCTEPAEGWCNGRGYCGCPFYNPPHDAGAPPTDAAMVMDAI